MGHAVLAQNRVIPEKDARELLSLAGCSAAEIDILVRSACEAPIRGTSPAESLTAMAAALAVNPSAKEDFLELAHLPVEDRERCAILLAFVRHELPRFNVGFPFCEEELAGRMMELLRTLWPESHESCLAGAMMVGVIPVPRALEWKILPFAMVKCMRETAPADRSMRLGYGR